MVELEDTLGLGSSLEIIKGSSPFSGNLRETIQFFRTGHSTCPIEMFSFSFWKGGFNATIAQAFNERVYFKG